MSFHYRFRAVDRDGKSITGNIHAKNRKEALYILENKGLHPIVFKENKLARFFGNDIVSNLLVKLGLREYSIRDLMMFCRQLSTLLQSGIPVLRALNILSTHLDKAIFRKKVLAASVALEEGSSLAEALESQSRFFPPLLISMVEAGEAGGVLDEVMERVADHYERQHDLEEKIRSATAYPLFITVLAFMVMAVMVIFVLPQFSNIINQMGMEMPLFSQYMMKTGAFVSTHWLYLIIALIALIIFTAFLLQTKQGRLAADRILPRLPLYGKIYRQIAAARFARTMGTLLSSGLALHRSLALTDKLIGNMAISESVDNLGKALNRGEHLADALLTERCFPPLLAEMVRIGEETGSLEYTLEKTADYYEKEVSYVIGRLSSILEPVLLLIVGSFIGILVFSILAPMYQVFQLI
ncbi:MAG: type II secretion system F family protein [Bacillota bacterium]|nr:type II secretion system F family protein [Bacillota bacterium]